MGLLSGFVMVAAGAVCLGGAVISRHWLGAAASAVMLAAMADSAFFGLVAPIVWVGALVAAGILLGWGLRPGPAAPQPGAHRTTHSAAARPSPASRSQGVTSAGVPSQGVPSRVRLSPVTPISRHTRLPHAVMVAAALAYPVCAWLLLGHAPVSPAIAADVIIASGSADGARASGFWVAPAPTSVAGADGHAGHASSGFLTGTLPLAIALTLAAVLAALTLPAARQRNWLPAAEAGGMSAMLLAMLLGHG